jgi:hypothetical protein
MSTELLLLLAFFVLLPLLQQLLRAARQPKERTPERAGAQAMQESQPQLPAHSPPPRAPVGAQRPATARYKLSEAMTAREGAPARDAAGPVAPVPTTRRSARRRTAVADLRNPRGLRRAIVVMTILGPCRASRP